MITQQKLLDKYEEDLKSGDWDALLGHGYTPFEERQKVKAKYPWIRRIFDQSIPVRFYHEVIIEIDLLGMSPAQYECSPVEKIYFLSMAGEKYSITKKNHSYHVIDFAFG